MVYPLSPSPVLLPFVQNYLVLSHHFEEHIQKQFSARGIPMLVFPFGLQSKSSFSHGDDSGKDYLRASMDKPALLFSNSVHSMCTFVGQVSFVMVMLKPTAAFHFIKESVHDKRDSVLMLDELDRASPFLELQERLWGVSTAAAAVALVESYLVPHFQHCLTGTPGDFAPVLDTMLQRPSGWTVQGLANKYRCTERWIEKQCALQTGLPPKTWLRLIRYRSAANYKLLHPMAPWMEVVARFGYVDQSHLIRDFKQFSGNTPTMHLEKEGGTERVFHQNGIGLSGLIGARG